MFGFCAVWYDRTVMEHINGGFIPSQIYRKKIGISWVEHAVFETVLALARPMLMESTFLATLHHDINI